MSSAKLTYSVCMAIVPTSEKFVIGQAATIATAEQAFEWYTGTLPAHFRPDARIRYGSAYTARTIEYTRKKLRHYGHDADMVYSGEMRDEYQRGKPVTSGKQNKSNTVTVLKFPFVRKANFWQGGKSGKRHNFAREMTAFNPSDSKKFNEGVEAKMTPICQRLITDQTNVQTETFEAN
jgi:hypothetical protein